MADKPMTADTNAPFAEAGAPTAPVAPRRPPGHRSTDVRDTVAEMAARAQEISQEAGSKVAAAMKDVIGAAAHEGRAGDRGLAAGPAALQQRGDGHGGDAHRDRPGA